MITLKSIVRSLGGRFGLATHSVAVEPPGEREVDFYDLLYASSEVYQDHYTKSFYYFLWSVIVDRARHAQVRRVLEIGCGPGQLAAFLMDQCVEHYQGLDFSSQAIELARRNVPRGRFVVGDARDSALYHQVEHDLLICTEVLEHITEDLQVVARFQPGKRCICTVPNFPYPSHVRHFRDAAEVAGRYGRFFHDLDIVTFKSPNSLDDEFFLFDGVRNHVTTTEA